MQAGHGGGGDGGPIGQAIIGQASPVVQGGGQSGGHEGAVVLVDVPVALTVQGGGQATIAGLPAGGQGCGHAGGVPVAVLVEQGGGQTGCGWVPVLVLVVQGGITQRTAGQAAPGGQIGGGGQGAGWQAAPSAQGGGHGSGFTGTRGIRTLLVSCRAPCRLCLFERLWWRR